MFNDLVDILNEIRNSKHSVLKISKVIGINHDKLYSYLSDRAKPKAEDFVKLQNWYAEILKVKLLAKDESAPEIQDLVLNEPQMKYYTKDQAIIKELQDEILRLKAELYDVRRAYQEFIGIVEADDREHTSVNSPPGKTGGRRTS